MLYKKKKTKKNDVIFQNQNAKILNILLIKYQSICMLIIQPLTIVITLGLRKL